MEPTTFAYDVCRCYVRDYASELEDYSHVLLGWVRSRNLPKLAQAMSLFDPAKSGVTVFRHLRQIEAFFKKNAVYSQDELCTATALSSFLDAEKRCRITNRRLDHYYLQRDRLDPDLKLWMDRAERYIDLTLGSFDKFLEGLPSRIRVTAGATSTAGRSASQPHRKIRLRQTCTPGSSKYLRALALHFGVESVRFKYVNWNRVEFVPKNWSTHRTIACEPEGVIPPQLAFDDYAKERLLSRGVNLKDQSRNQRLARQASIDGRKATVDVKQASDSEAFNTVAWLFPQRWFEYLNDLRSPYYKLPDGSFGKYAKFSSMGNGTTFTTETLIFAAACHAVGSKDFSVYGDDIIIETELFRDLKRMLKFLGFTINDSKSFSSGPFRESCGGDFYHGENVTPFYVRQVDSRKTVLCNLVNGLAAVGYPEGHLWRYLTDLIRKEKLPLVPVMESTIGGIHIDVHTAYGLGLIRSHHQIVRVKSYVSKTRSFFSGDIRTYFLWFLQRNRGFWELRPVESSRVPALHHKYVRKWVGWYPPASGTPVHLYWWTEFITR